jgi:hypothetical protein
VKLQHKALARVDSHINRGQCRSAHDWEQRNRNRNQGFGAVHERTPESEHVLNFAIYADTIPNTDFTLSSLTTSVKYLGLIGRFDSSSRWGI